MRQSLHIDDSLTDCSQASQNNFWPHIMRSGLTEWKNHFYFVAKIKIRHFLFAQFIVTLWEATFSKRIVPWTCKKLCQPKRERGKFSIFIGDFWGVFILLAIKYISYFGPYFVFKLVEDSKHLVQGL